MIAGIFLRNFKTYEKFNFIPFTEGNNEKLNLFIGNNGAGKSSVLEAIDVFFNNREFILNDNARSRDASIAPVFLIKKDKISILQKPDLIEFTEQLSDFFWNEELSTLYGSNPSIEQFVNFRESLKAKSINDEYLLLLFGHELINKDYSLISMEPKALTKLHSLGIESIIAKKQINSLAQNIKYLYNYIYIPVETSITDFLKLEASGMQSLMNKDLKDEIEGILSERKFEVAGRGTRNRTVSINQFINEKLKEYIENIESSIQHIDGEYHFNRELRSTTVNPKDFSDVIINTFFTKRRLQKNDREIAYLSSGERKKALIDIAFSFIAQNNETEKEIIIAIDEPEASLHISMCFEQYMRIEQIANKFNIQSFITTHWYGGLPILSNGRLYHVLKEENVPKIELFNLENYFEQRKNHPDDINLKSFYDLTSSIISSVRNNSDKWLIVEGLADKKYLEHYLPENHGFKILPVGGCSIVKKIYEYLYLPLSQDEETVTGEGRIFCLIDTDAKAEFLSIPSTTKNRMLAMRRLQIDAGEIKLFKLEQALMNVNTETEFEETLNPVKFYNSLKKLINTHGSSYLTTDEHESIKDVFECYELDIDSQFSFIKGENSFLKAKVIGRRNARDIKEIHRFFDDYKEQICMEYVTHPVGNTPSWISFIIDNYLN